MTVLNDILEKDAGADIITLDKENQVDFIYLQSSAMKANFAKFPELLVMDTC